MLKQVATGRSNTEIAGELFLGLQTVKTHVAAVLAKLKARDRTQAVVIAYETGSPAASRGDRIQVTRPDPQTHLHREL